MTEKARLSYWQQCAKDVRSAFSCFVDEVVENAFFLRVRMKRTKKGAAKKNVTESCAGFLLIRFTCRF